MIREKLRTRTNQKSSFGLGKRSGRRWIGGNDSPWEDFCDDDDDCSQREKREKRRKFFFPRVVELFSHFVRHQLSWAFILMNTCVYTRRRRRLGIFHFFSIASSRAKHEEGKQQKKSFSFKIQIAREWLETIGLFFGVWCESRADGDEWLTRSEPTWCDSIVSF